MMRLTNKILRSIEPDVKTPENYEYMRKIFLLRFLILIGATIFIVYVVRNALLGLWGLSILNLTATGVLIFINFKLNKRHLIDFISLFGAIYLLIHFLVLNLIDYNNPMSLIWAIIYPIITYFLLGLKPGIIFSFILMILLFIINKVLGIENALFNNVTYFEYFFTYTGITLITYVIVFSYLKISKLYKYSHNELIKKNEELELANKLITELETKYQKMIDMANDVILLIENGKIIYANKKAFEILGTNEKDLINKNFLDFVHPTEKSRVHQLHKQRLKNNIEIQPYETIIQKKDGLELYTEVNGSILDLNGRKIVMVILRDITLRKIQQEEREVLIAELEETREKLLKDKHELIDLNAKLQESEQNLKNIINIKDKFLQIISHDLINPISGSRHLISLLYDDFESLNNEELKEILSALKSTAINLDEMLQTLILWAKSQSNQIIPNPINFDISDLIKDIISLLATQARNKQINLVQDTTGKVKVFADINMIHTILRNLISNAIKFTFEKGTINIGVKDIDDKFIGVYVKDNGIGMSKETTDKLFDVEKKFTTIGTNSEKGYGLGLLIVKDFVELNGGQISVESELNKGTTFVFTIPKSNGK